MSAQMLFDEQKIKKSSRQSAVITLVGVIIVGGAFLYGLYELSAVNEQIDQKREFLDSLSYQSESLQKQIDVLRSNARELEQSYAQIEKAVAATQNPKLQREFSEALPFIAMVKPRARAVENRETKGERETYYDFSLWIELPRERRAEILDVVYEFNHPTFRQKAQRSTNPEEGFRVRHIGWGCLSSVIITVNLRNGSSSSIDFDMCAELGWGAGK